MSTAPPLDTPPRRYEKRPYLRMSNIALYLEIFDYAKRYMQGSAPI